MFDESEFVTRLKGQLNQFDMEAQRAWVIAPNVFVAKARIKGDPDWTFIFYHDSAKTAFRDSALMDRRVQLLMEGFSQGALSADPEDSVRIFHFGDGLLGCSVGYAENAINYASQLLTKQDGPEIEWFDKPECVAIE